MLKFDEFEDKKKGVKNYIIKFEEALKKLPIINFNDDSIEFPNMIVFTKKEKSLLYSMLNPSVEIFKVEEEDFKNMLAALTIESENILFVDKKVSPKTTARINLELLKESVVYIREYDDTLICNEVLFTTSETEFQGTGMFTSRSEVFWVIPDIFVKIKNFIKA